MHVVHVCMLLGGGGGVNMNVFVWCMCASDDIP